MPPNPVVYSRFGKVHYYSEEKYHWRKFDEQKTNTLYVNIKSLIEMFTDANTNNNTSVRIGTLFPSSMRDKRFSSELFSNQ